MREYSMNNIYEDKTFIMFDRREPGELRSNLHGRAYFVEKSTGRLCLIYRFRDEIAEAQELASRNIFKPSVAVIALVLLAAFAMGDFYYRYYSGIISNVLVLFVLIALTFFSGIWLIKNDYRELFEDYQKAARRQSPIFLDSNQTEEALRRARLKKWRMLFFLAIALCLVIGTGYHFIATSDTRYLISTSLLTIFLTRIPNPKEWWSSMSIASKMYFSKSLGRKED